MSKGKYDKISNYNLSYENFLEAIAEFEGFITGISNNDIFLFISDAEDYNKINTAIESTRDKELDFFVKNIAARILDRTTGTYFFNDMFNGNVQDTYFKLIAGNTSPKNKLVNLLTQRVHDSFDSIFGQSTGMGKYLHIIGPNGDNNVVTSTANNAFQNCVPIIGDDTTSLNMSNTIKYYDVSDLQKNSQLDAAGTPVYNDVDGVSTPKEYYSGATYDGTPKQPEINKNRIGDRFNRPNLCGLVFRHPKASWSARNKSHLPIFFNAINAIEMSRCVPYIDIRIVTRKYGESDDDIGDLSQVKFMRFIKKKGGKFDLDDDIGFGDYSPVNNSESAAEEKVNNLKLDYSYMDIFTTPQTFSNANINKESGNMFAKNGNINDPILEPISPFLTLKSLNVNITGAGFGLMASKRGSLSFKLHDRSRLTDLAPLLSTTQFATTKIIIEYGWNHPEGGVNSDNVIGKYLDALKERSVFQVVGSDFKFSEGNTIDIDVDLTAYGFRQTERVHCGMGPEVPLNVLEDFIEKATSDAIKSLKKKNGEVNNQAPEIRQKIKTNSRSARSLSAAISWSAYEEIAGSIKNKDKDNVLLEKLKTILIPNKNASTEDSINDLSGVIAAELEVKNAISRVFGKLNDINNTTPKTDGFCISTVTGANIKTASVDSDQGVQASLGKILSHFIGHPLAATCLYDEVQMVFYPMNHHAAGGRVHTTASFPIPAKILEEKVIERIKRNNHLSVKAFFTLIEKIVRDKNLPVYGVSDLYKSETALKSVKPAEFKDIMMAKIITKDITGLGVDEDLDKELLDLLQSSAELTDETFYDKLTKKSEVTQKDLAIIANNKNISQLAKADPAYRAKKPNGPTSFTFTESVGTTEGTPQTLDVEVNLATAEIELTKARESGAKLKQERDSLLVLSKRYKKIKSALIADAIATRKTALSERCAELYGSDGLTDLYPAEDKFVRPNITIDYEVIDVIKPPSEGFTDDETDASSKGLYEDKQILRVHVYDEEGVSDPEQHTLLNTLIEGVSNKVIGGEEYAGLNEKIKNLSFNQVKQLIKRAYPTIIYGAQNSTINNISVSSNTSGELANVIMVESYGNLRNGQVDGHNHESEFESAILFPNTVTVEMMGMPMIGRGNSIFIDFGTNTSVDNIYTVKNVSHSLSAGSFTTSVQAVPSNMGAISSFKERIAKSITAIEKNT